MKKGNNHIQHEQTIEDVLDKAERVLNTQDKKNESEELKTNKVSGNELKKEAKTNKIKEKKKIPKQISQEILKKIFKNLIMAIVVMIYFIFCNGVYTYLELEQMETITKVISGIFLIASIISLEFAYKRESGTLTMTAIELLVLSIHALFINYIITVYEFDFKIYLLTSSYIFATYYVIKATIVYTRAKVKYLRSLSDISDIVKDEPIIKEAKKREETLISNTEPDLKDKKDKKRKKSKLMQGKTKESKNTKTKKSKEKETSLKQEKNKETKKGKTKNKSNPKTSKQESAMKQLEDLRKMLYDKLELTSKIQNEEEVNNDKEKEIEQKEIEEKVNKKPKPKSKRGRKKKENNE